MINADIHEDLFFPASIPTKQAWSLCPAGVAPVSIGGRGWLAMSVVKLSRVTFFGVPVASQAICAGLLLIVEYSDREGRQRRGNLFLRGYTTSRLLARFDAVFALGVFRFSPMSLDRRGTSAAVTIPGEFAAQVDMRVQAVPETSCEELFEGNHSAVVKLGKSPCHVQLRKAHWRLRRRTVEIVDGSIFSALGATMECCFDTSESRGSWALPRRIGHFRPLPADQAGRASTSSESP